IKRHWTTPRTRGQGPGCDRCRHRERGPRVDGVVDSGQHRPTPPPKENPVRAYLTTTTAKARAILTVGYDDPDEFDGRAGNWLGDRPLTAHDCFEGDAVLRVDIADEL